MSAFRWAAFGSGIVWGYFRWGQSMKTKANLLRQKKEAYEAEIHELQGRVKTLENDLRLARGEEPVAETPAVHH